VLKKDIDACFESDVALVHTFVPTSDVQRIYTIKKSQEEVIQLAVEAVQYIKDHGLKCMFSAMDATRTDPAYLIEVFKAVQEAGCDIINVPDTVGVMVPSAMYRQIKDIAAEITIPIDVHCHNDFGLAVANSLMAVEAGASQVQVTINGIGERAGNADLSQTVMSLTSIYGAKTNIRTEYLVETSKMVENYTGIRLPPNTPVVGQNAFSHESGIHSQGVLEKSDTFEPGIMTPEMVGHRRRIVLGKHTGKHAVKQSLESAGIKSNDNQLDEIVLRIKEIANKGKQITDADLYAVASAVLGKASSDEELIKLKEVSVMTGNIITPTAVVESRYRRKRDYCSKNGSRTCGCSPSCRKGHPWREQPLQTSGFQDRCYHRWGRCSCRCLHRSRKREGKNRDRTVCKPGHSNGFRGSPCKCYEPAVIKTKKSKINSKPKSR